MALKYSSCCFIQEEGKSADEYWHASKSRKHVLKLQVTIKKNSKKSYNLETDRQKCNNKYQVNWIELG